jgi:hypothetical protein
LSLRTMSEALSLPKSEVEWCGNLMRVFLIRLLCGSDFVEWYLENGDCTFRCRPLLKGRMGKNPKEAQSY